MTEASRIQKLLNDQNAEIDRLKEEIRQLREDLSEVDVGLYHFLSRQQAALLSGICKRDIATLAYLDNITEEHGKYDRYSGEMHQTLRTKVAVWKLRNKLKPHGIEIQVVRGVGYSIDGENRKKLIELMRGLKK
jgi:DNA-binding response OmpR family regulator